MLMYCFTVDAFIKQWVYCDTPNYQKLEYQIKLLSNKAESGYNICITYETFEHSTSCKLFR